MNNTDLNNMRLLESVLQKVLPDVVFPGDTFSNGKVRVALADCNYDDKSLGLDAGFAWTRRHLERSKEPVLIIGYDREETVRRRAEGSLLENSGIAYIRLPARLEEIRAAIKDIKPGGLDEESVLRNKEDVKKNVSTLRHNIKNLLDTVEPNLNRLKNAEAQTVDKKWLVAKEAIIASGIERVEKELKLYDGIRGSINKGNDLYEKLKEADKLYKVLFNAFSSNTGGDSIDSILKCGDALIHLLKNVITVLEDMKNE